MQDRVSSDAGNDWLGDLLAPVRRRLGEVVALSFIVNILAIAVPIFVLQVYDRVVFHGGLSTLQGLVVGVLIALAFDFALRQGRGRLLRAAAVEIDVSLARSLYGRITGAHRTWLAPDGSGKAVVATPRRALALLKPKLAAASTRSSVLARGVACMAAHGVTASAPKKNAAPYTELMYSIHIVRTARPSTPGRCVVCGKALSGDAHGYWITIHPDGVHHSCNEQDCSAGPGSCDGDTDRPETVHGVE